MRDSATVQRTLRVMTFNIHAGIGLDGRYDLERVASVVRDARPDVAGLQEVDRGYGARSGFDDQPARLAELTGMLSCYGPAIVLGPCRPGGDRREYGNLVLSRLPVRSARSTALPSTLEGRGVLEAVLDLGGTGLTFFDVHLGLGSGPFERLPQSDAVAARIDLAPPPRVLVGDVNVQPPAPELAPLVERLRDVWPHAGMGVGLTVPAAAPRRRIDVVLADATIRPVRAWTVPTDASDHLPVVCDLELTM